MCTKKGLWTIRKGKGNRIYINADNTYTGAQEGIIHPELLASNNGVGMYGIDVLNDLHDAINEFKEAHKDDYNDFVSVADAVKKYN